MTEHFIFYVESNVVCLILFGIMLVHDLLSGDRQEKQIKYDRALISFMLYFVADIFLTAVNSEVLPRSRATVALVNFADYVLMAAITITWLFYAMAVEQVENRNRKITRTAILFPFVIATGALLMIYAAAPQVLMDDALEMQPLFYVLMILVPVINIVAVLFYSYRRALIEKNPEDRRLFMQVGAFPLMVIIGGVIEVFLLPFMPIFCFCSAILMLIFYIKSMDVQISVDPLTKLSNRGQLMRYTLQTAHLFAEGSKTFVIMVDVNDFKTINDTFGHAEGDRALVIIADALRKAAAAFSESAFICRYGGDEFVLIVHAADEEALRPLFDIIRSGIEYECKARQTPYILSVSLGSAEFRSEADSIQECMRRADIKLYEDKKRCKEGKQSAA